MLPPQLRGPPSTAAGPPTATPQTCTAVVPQQLLRGPDPRVAAARGGAAGSFEASACPSSINACTDLDNNPLGQCLPHPSAQPSTPSQTQPHPTPTPPYLPHLLQVAGQHGLQRQQRGRCGTEAVPHRHLQQLVLAVPFITRQGGASKQQNVGLQGSADQWLPAASWAATPPGR